jgi:hypothetical protein
MSLIKAIKAQLGLSVTPANNFSLDASADNGTMKLARNSGQDIMTVAADGKVTFPATPRVYASGEVIQRLVFNGASTTGISATSLTNIINTLKSITPKSTNSTLYVIGIAQINGPAPAAGVNLSRHMMLYEGSVATPVGPLVTLEAISGAGTGISPGGSGVCTAILTNTALTARQFGLGGYVTGAGSANYSNLIVDITEIQN